MLAYNDSNNKDSEGGFSLDLRAGYTFNEGTRNTFNLSFELNPGWYTNEQTDYTVTVTGIGILLGYPYL